MAAETALKGPAVDLIKSMVPSARVELFDNAGLALFYYGLNSLTIFYQRATFSFFKLASGPSSCSSFSCLKKSILRQAEVVAAPASCN